ncbi:MAG TPA: ABC transporter substrate-binding protein [Acidimicrobiales bacterium]|nr:ABC transporter substrate-binding protein [Acidimicrobiales bacterium]
MGESPKKRTGLARYWPVLAVVAVVAAALGIGAVVGGGGGGDDDAAGSAGTSGEPPALAAFKGEDPMSAPDCDRSTGRLMIPTLLAPNCVPLWPKDRDNGGTTSPGVTEDEIVVAVYVPQLDPTVDALANQILGPDRPTPAENTELRKEIVQAYNALYEMYGRKIKLVEVNASGSASDDAAARADAIKIADDIHAFAAIDGPAQTNAYAEELAARKVICICVTGQPGDMYERLAPYAWGLTMSSSEAYVHRADYIVHRLAGKKAEFAGDPSFQTQDRKFALVYYETADNSRKAGVDAFVERLKDNGVTLADRIPYILDLSKATEDAGTIVARLKAKGVTSVVFSGDGFFPIYLTGAATQQDYNPEWVMTGSLGTDITALARRYDQKQWAHAFGISQLVARVDPDQLEKEANPVSWYLGKTLKAYPQIFQLGLVSSGIQLAGPDLTPDTFRGGLYALKPTRGYTTVTGSSFGTGDVWPDADYTGVDDVTEVWWDAKATGKDETSAEGTGMYRYMDNGKRYLPGEVGKSSSVPFDPADTITILPKTPAKDLPKQYPHRTSRTG